MGVEMFIQLHTFAGWNKAIQAIQPQVSHTLQGFW